MALVQGGQRRLVEPLDDGEDGGIHKPHVGVSVTVTELADAAAQCPELVVSLDEFDMWHALPVTPAEAGVQAVPRLCRRVGSGFRRNDKYGPEY
mgnify:CR=1 FL=1